MSLKYRNVTEKHQLKTIIAMLLLITGGTLFFLSRPPSVETGMVTTSATISLAVPEENSSEVEWETEFPVLEMEAWEPMRMKIPVLDFDMEVINGGVFDEELLQIAPVHFEMSDLPGTLSGNTAFAAHRRGQYAYFRDLDELKPGDQIVLETETMTYVYEMAWLKIVDPYDWSVIDSTERPALTLQTCEPKDHPGTHRLIARAYLEEIMPKKE